MIALITTWIGIGSEWRDEVFTVARDKSHVWRVLKEPALTVGRDGGYVTAFPLRTFDTMTRTK